jgi:hypothetical protein
MYRVQIPLDEETIAEGNKFRGASGFRRRDMKPEPQVHQLLNTRISDLKSCSEQESYILCVCSIWSTSPNVLAGALQGKRLHTWHMQLLDAIVALEQV